MAAGIGKGDIVITMLADDDAVEEIVLGSGGIIRALRENAIHLSMSTISVALFEVLTEAPIQFHSTEVSANGDSLRLSGELSLMGETQPLAFDVAVDGDGRLSASALVKQTNQVFTLDAVGG